MGNFVKAINPLPTLNHSLNPLQVFKDIKKNPQDILLPPGSRDLVAQWKSTGKALSGQPGAPGAKGDERGVGKGPPIAPVIPLPDPGNPDIKRRAIAQRRAAGTGRANTIFSEVQGSALGGG